MNDQFYSGFSLLEEELSDILRSVENVENILVEAAKEYVKDVGKLPKPYSNIRRAGYTHMLDSISYRRSRRKGEVEVGSTSAYYLTFVERGTNPSSKRKWGTPRQPFLEPTYNKNRMKYEKIMLQKLGLER